MSADLVTWLRACLDKDERLARACIAEVGQTRAGEMYPDGSGPAEVDDFPSYPYGSREHESIYIARHHPDRALADIAAKRAVIDRYEELARYDSSESLEVTAELGWVVRHLASAYADRPGYRMEWKP